MAIDLSIYQGERREQLIGAGRSIGSETVQQLADHFSNSLKVHGAALKGAGYADSDGQELSELCAESKRLCKERPEVARDKNAARDALRREVKQSKQLRLAQRDALDVTLHIKQDTIEPATLDEARGVLRETRSAGADNAALKLQLLALAGIYEHAQLAPLLAERGQGGAAAALRAQAQRLEDADKAAQQRPGTAEQTSELDTLDGLMIERMRAIRKLARRAATKAGDPTIADAFSIDAIS